jgi:hypothetical protein
MVQDLPGRKKKRHGEKLKDEPHFRARVDGPQQGTQAVLGTAQGMVIPDEKRIRVGG